MNARIRFALVSCALAFAMFLPAMALGLGCTDIGGVDAAETCTLSTTYTCVGSTSISIPDNFVIAASGTIDCAGTSGSSPTAGSNLTLTVVGDLTIAGAIFADGGTGSGGVNGQAGVAGADGGSVQITVSGNMTIDSSGLISATGGAGGAGGSPSISGDGGAGANAGSGGSVNISVDLAYTQTQDGTIDVSGGAGGSGAAGQAIAGGSANGGNGANGGAGGTVTIFSCSTLDDGDIGASGGSGGGGGGGVNTGHGGNNGSGASAAQYAITEESGTNFTFGAHALRVAVGGPEGNVGAGGGGIGGSPGSDIADPGNGGGITFNHCPSGSIIGFTGLPDERVLIYGGSGSGQEPPGADGTVNTLDTAPCCPCSIAIDKKVAPDVGCDGTPDSAFVNSVTVDSTQCVVYQICVTNTSDVGATVPPDVPQPVDNVQVNDADLGVTNVSFGTILPGAANKVCKQIPGAISADKCTGGTCVCSTVAGTNHSAIDLTTAVCGADQTQACSSAASDCSDTADAACNTPTPTPTITPTPTETGTPTQTPTPRNTPTPTVPPVAPVMSPTNLGVLVALLGLAGLLGLSTRRRVG